MKVYKTNGDIHEMSIDEYETIFCDKEFIPIIEEKEIIKVTKPRKVRKTKYKKRGKYSTSNKENQEKFIEEKVIEITDFVLKFPKKQHNFLNLSAAFELKRWTDKKAIIETLKKDNRLIIQRFRGRGKSYIIQAISDKLNTDIVRINKAPKMF